MNNGKKVREKLKIDRGQSVDEARGYYIRKNFSYGPEVAIRIALASKEGSRSKLVQEPGWEKEESSTVKKGKRWSFEMGGRGVLFGRIAIRNARLSVGGRKNGRSYMASSRYRPIDSIDTYLSSTLHIIARKCRLGCLPLYMKLSRSTCTSHFSFSLVSSGTFVWFMTAFFWLYHANNVGTIKNSSYCVWEASWCSRVPYMCQSFCINLRSL